MTTTSMSLMYSLEWLYPSAVGLSSTEWYSAKRSLRSLRFLLREGRSPGDLEGSCCEAERVLTSAEREEGTGRCGLER